MKWVENGITYDKLDYFFLILWWCFYFFHISTYVTLNNGFLLLFLLTDFKMWYVPEL